MSDKELIKKNLIYLFLYLILIFLIFIIFAIGSTVNKKEKVIKVTEENKIETKEIQKAKKTEFNTYKVIEVIDGDTIKIEKDGKLTTVRLLQVDTPESVNPNSNRNVPIGKTAKQFTEKFIGTDFVRLEYDKEKTDKYGRLLAFVYVGNKCLNEELVRNGIAKVVKYEPNVAKYDEYKEIERQVRPTGIGIWGNIEESYPPKKQSNSPSNVVSTPPPSTEKTPIVKTNVTNEYIGNNSSKKFHNSDCPSVKKMKANHRVILESKEEAVKKGYTPCKNCNP